MLLYTDWMSFASIQNVSLHKLNAASRNPGSIYLSTYGHRLKPIPKISGAVHSFHSGEAISTAYSRPTRPSFTTNPFKAVAPLAHPVLNHLYIFFHPSDVNKEYTIDQCL